MPYDTEAEATFRQEVVKELRRLEELAETAAKIQAVSAKETHEFQRSPWQIRMGDITTIISVAGLIWTASQAFGRLDALDKSHIELKERIKPVEEIGWKLDGLRSEVDDMKQADKESAMQVSEIHQTLIRMGVNVAGKQQK